MSKKKFQSNKLSEIVEKINNIIEAFNNQFSTNLNRIHSGSICFNENGKWENGFLEINWKWKKVNNEKILEVSIGSFNPNF